MRAIVEKHHFADGDISDLAAPPEVLLVQPQVRTDLGSRTSVLFQPA
jgi:hypothetical protein